MARKTNVTIGLPKPVLDAVDKARGILYEKSLTAQARRRIGEGRYSRSVVMEILITEGLHKNGIDINWGKLRKNAKKK
jgi:hypothetical protein